MLPKRVRMLITSFLTLVAACAWESSWFGKRSEMRLNFHWIAPPTN
jgi:hypothetical protein